MQWLILKVNWKPVTNNVLVDHLRNWTINDTCSCLCFFFLSLIACRIVSHAALEETKSQRCPVLFACVFLSLHAERFMLLVFVWGRQEQTKFLRNTVHACCFKTCPSAEIDLGFKIDDWPTRTFPIFTLCSLFVFSSFRQRSPDTPQNTGFLCWRLNKVWTFLPFYVKKTLVGYILGKETNDTELKKETHIPFQCQRCSYCSIGWLFHLQVRRVCVWTFGLFCVCCSLSFGNSIWDPMCFTWKLCRSSERLALGSWRDWRKYSIWIESVQSRSSGFPPPQLNILTFRNMHVQNARGSREISLDQGLPTLRVGAFGWTTATTSCRDSK